MLQIRILIFALTYLSSTGCALSTQEPSNDSLLPKINSHVDQIPISLEDVQTVPKIYEMKIISNITDRFGITQITSKLENSGHSPEQATFFVILPQAAFISDIGLEKNGKTYTYETVKNEEVEKMFIPGKPCQTPDVRVETTVRDSKNFTVSINVQPKSNVTVTLTYEQLLVRKKDQFEVAFNVYPGQPVENFNIEVNINGSQRIKYFRTVPFSSSDHHNYSCGDGVCYNKNEFNNTSLKLSFNPNLEDQKAFADKLEENKYNASSGLYVVQYDVERDPLKEEMMIDARGHFVHFFPPSKVPLLKKHVVFVLDTHSNMEGNKIKQLKIATKSILGELKKEDTFNIIEVQNRNIPWNIALKKREFLEVNNLMYRPNDFNLAYKSDIIVDRAFEADDQNIKNANEIVDDMYAYGDNPFWEWALERALSLVIEAKKANNSSQPIIVLLTGGEIRMTEDRISEFTRHNEDTVPIYSLSFGDRIQTETLRKISHSSHGIDSHIYDNEDVSLRAKAFYRQILQTFHDKYQNVTNVTNVFPLAWLEGSELIVLGRILDEKYDPPPIYFDRHQSYQKPIEAQAETTIRAIWRFWAYMVYQQMLEKIIGEFNEENNTKEASNLASSYYSFVTPFNSMVIKTPLNDDATIPSPPLCPLKPHSDPWRPHLPTGPDYPGNALPPVHITYPVDRPPHLPEYPSYPVNRPPRLPEYPSYPGYWPPQPPRYPSCPGYWPPQPPRYPSCPGYWYPQPAPYPVYPGYWYPQPAPYPVYPGQRDPQPVRFPGRPDRWPQPLTYPSYPDTDDWEFENRRPRISGQLLHKGIAPTISAAPPELKGDVSTTPGLSRNLLPL